MVFEALRKRINRFMIYTKNTQVGFLRSFNHVERRLPNDLNALGLGDRRSIQVLKAMANDTA